MAQELSDTASLILSGAANNVYGNILPYRPSMKAFGIALNRTLAQLEENGLIEKSAVKLDEPSMKDEHGRFTFRITGKGRSAMNITDDPPGNGAEQSATSGGDQTQPEGESDMAKTAAKKSPAKKAAAPKKPKAASTERRKPSPAATGVSKGRSATFKGKFLYPSKNLKPRRAGSFGEASLAIIQKKPGISYDDFVKAGGRPNDLNWDVKAGNVDVKSS